LEVKRPKEQPKEDLLECHHFNIKCRGDIIFHRVRVKFFRQFQANVIELAWCVEQRRELTREEIKKLCAPKS
jgi:hypothetical protein